FHILASELIYHEPDLPRNYGVDSSGINFVTIPRSDETWPLELRYSESRELDPNFFTLQWQGLSNWLGKKWGIPAPLKMKLVADPAYPKTHLRLQGTDIQPLELELAADELKALISSKKMAAPGIEFLQRFTQRWEPFKEPLLQGGPYFIV